MTFLAFNKFTFTVVIASLSLTLSGCDKPENDSSTSLTETNEHSKPMSSIEQAADMFVGCYTVVQDEPSQIKVSLNEQGLVMQMKEPKSANRVWDTPEPLIVVPLNKSSNYFFIDNENIKGLIGRPDDLFVLGYVDEAYANIDPLLDSQYLGYIVQDSNTIYKVECDEVFASESP